MRLYRTAVLFTFSIGIDMATRSSEELLNTNHQSKASAPFGYREVSIICADNHAY
jgi:hypothetical protein